MIMLAIDTATRWTGLALHNGKELLAEYGWKAQFTQTIETAPTVTKMLERAELSPSDVSAVTVAIGPGSYTGLRVGLGFAKGFALVQNVPLIGVSTLDIVASTFGASRNQLVAIAEAGRGRVCAGTYHWTSTGWTPLDEPDIYNWDDLLEKAVDGSHFAGEITSEARAKITQSEKRFFAVTPSTGARRAGSLAEIGIRRYINHDFDNSAELVPTYLRDPGGAKPKK